MTPVTHDTCQTWHLSHMTPVIQAVLY